MLKYLRLQNIILVEQAEIPFSTGLNIITGETGSGKSAIMHGLSLSIGERSDSAIIRKGCEKGVLEAVFEIDNYPALLHFLKDSGIDHELGQEFIIKREISHSGKSRVFINHQSAQLALLRQIGNYLVHQVGQHANQQLLYLEYHRQIIDLYGDLEALLNLYQRTFEKENALRKELDILIQQEAQRFREIDICHKEIEELEEAQLKENEDEDLFAEYTLLVNAKELAEKIYEINQTLSGERQSPLAILNKQKLSLESLVRFDSSLTETVQSLHNVLLELQEIMHTLRHYQSSIQEDPERLLFINNRLTLINQLKRKYGTTVEEIKSYYVLTKQKLEQLENADIRIEELQKELKATIEKADQLAQQLTEKRVQTAKQLEVALTAQLRSLNMPKAHFTIQITTQKRTPAGDDKVEFFLQPNVGEHQIALREAASGGEISRFLLALQTLLAGKGKTPTLIFDEVDANIGGETAAIVGNKLREIGQQHQVICITHFPQVASCAHHHLQIAKQEKEGRTVTQVHCLDLASQKKELHRMLGGLAIGFEEYSEVRRVF